MTISVNTAPRLSNAQSKTSSTKATNVKKTTGITVKRKPASPTNPNSNISSSIKAASNQPSPHKKNHKKPTAINGKSTSVGPVAAASFDLEATLCPICDEACTCPKTAVPVLVPKTSVKKLINKKLPASPAIKKKEAPKYLNKKLYELTESSDFESVDEEVEAKEDPALSFIRMIYSDEESLDEEEAYALYQATQLFSSSDDEEYEARGFTSKRIDCSEEDGCDSDEYTTESEDSENEFEYTVVEYVQPLKTKKTFVAYDSDDEDSDEASLSASLQDQLLLNATANDPGSDHDGEMDSCDEDNIEGFSSSEEDGNWLTYSVFDVDSDLPNLTSGNGGTCLSSHGSGTPDTLLFSTSSTDKIPNIAPQVLAAISAAAKHMAAANHSGNATPSKYFSYITLRETAREYVDGEEFLFFEEARSKSFDIDTDTELDIEENDCISSCDSINSLDSLSDGALEPEPEDEDCFSDESIKKKRPRTLIRPPTAVVPVVSTMSVSSDFMTSLNRWSRVPIGAFRRSRRPSIPSYHHSVHPSTALKTFSTDPASLTLTPSPSHHNQANEDSFDESSCNMGIEGPERSYSVITWDELDLDIVPNTTSNTSNSSPTNMQSWPLPKRSRSVISAPTNLTNNFEWLNNSNWNWES